MFGDVPSPAAANPEQGEVAPRASRAGHILLERESDDLGERKIPALGDLAQPPQHILIREDGRPLHPNLRMLGHTYASIQIPCEETGYTWLRQVRADDGLGQGRDAQAVAGWIAHWGLVTQGLQVVGKPGCAPLLTHRSAIAPQRGPAREPTERARSQIATGEVGIGNDALVAQPLEAAGHPFPGDEALGHPYFGLTTSDDSEMRAFTR